MDVKKKEMNKNQRADLLAISDKVTIKGNEMCDYIEEMHAMVEDLNLTDEEQNKLIEEDEEFIASQAAMATLHARMVKLNIV